MDRDAPTPLRPPPPPGARAEVRPLSSRRRGVEDARSEPRIPVICDGEEVLVEVEPEEVRDELHGHVLAIRASVERSEKLAAKIEGYLEGFMRLFRRVGNPKVVGAALVALDLIPKIVRWVLAHL